MFGTTLKKIFKRQPANSQQNELTILYGSHTGNSEFIAKEAQKLFKKNGISTGVFDLARYSPQKLTHENSVLIVISTHGEGDPPDAAQKFFVNLFSDEAPSLAHLNYSVCALGDSSYEHFCKTGKDIDLRFKELGARRFYNRVDCDVEFQLTATSWISGILSTYHETNGENTDVPALISSAPDSTFNAEVKSKYLLNEGCEPDTYHIVLSVNDESFHYKSGDSIRIVPQNSKELVEKITGYLQANPQTTVSYENKNVALEQLFREKLELTSLSKGVLERYFAFTHNKDLFDLMGNEEQLHDYLQNNDVLDLVTDFPFNGGEQELVNILRKIQPRYYSVTSALAKHPGEVHLIVKLVQAENRGRLRNGACSSYLNNWLEPGHKTEIRVVKNEQFRLPKDNSPVIMIAAGTGIAPFRAFLEEKEAGRFNGDCWLVFGEKYRQYNFFYQKEWENWGEHKLLERLDVAFSRDHHKKIYVQDKILEQATEFCNWLNRGAHIYICGSIEMGKDVKDTIQQVFEKYAENDNIKSPLTWKTLLNKGCIHEDVY